VIKIIQGGSPWFTSKSSSPSVYPRVFVRFSQETYLQSYEDFLMTEIIQGGNPCVTSISSAPSVYPRVFVRFYQEDILAEL